VLRSAARSLRRLIASLSGQSTPASATPQSTTAAIQFRCCPACTMATITPAAATVASGRRGGRRGCRPRRLRPRPIVSRVAIRHGAASQGVTSANREARLA